MLFNYLPYRLIFSFVDNFNRPTTSEKSDIWSREAPPRPIAVRLTAMLRVAAESRVANGLIDAALHEELRSGSSLRPCSQPRSWLSILGTAMVMVLHMRLYWLDSRGRWGSGYSSLPPSEAAPLWRKVLIAVLVRVPPRELRDLPPPRQASVRPPRLRASRPEEHPRTEATPLTVALENLGSAASASNDAGVPAEKEGRCFFLAVFSKFFFVQEDYICHGSEI